MLEKLNSAVELHDSVVDTVWRSEQTVLLALRPAYIHKSPGQPGVDDGIGLVQNIVIEIECGQIEGNIGDLPADVFDGEFQSGSQTFPNMISLPCDIEGGYP
jgi:hypothetical protein